MGRYLLLVAALLLMLVPTAPAQSIESWRDMNRPVEPFRIMGNLYYVGANSVTSFLITTPDGHILIDSGFQETVPMIRESVAKLGFEFDDIRILLNSHAHIDHAGGLAEIKRLTGAKMIASAADAPLLERGGRGDPIIGDIGHYPPVQVDRRVNDGEIVELGGAKLTARVTPGHTPGCTSWAMEVEEDGESYLAVSICSLSILDGMQFLEEPTYPGIADDFARSIEILEGLPCEVFLASHAGFFKMKEKRPLLGDEERSNPFIDPVGYRRYVDRAEEKLRQALARER